MKLSDALAGISHRRFMDHCHLKGRSLAPVADRPYRDLSPAYIVGLESTLRAIMRIQNLVFYYDIQFITHMMKDAGIRIGPFYDSLGLGPAFKYNRYIPAAERGERLIIIRIGLLRLAGQLLDYITSDVLALDEIAGLGDDDAHR